MTVLVQTKQKKYDTKNKVNLYPTQEKSTQRLFLFTAITSPVNVYCTYKKTAFLERKNNKGGGLIFLKKVDSGIFCLQHH